MKEIGLVRLPSGGMMEIFSHMMTNIYDGLAIQDFERAKCKAFWRDLRSRLTRNSNQLMTFDQIRKGLSIKGQRDRGLQVVPLDRIVATEEGHRDFDRAFFPRQSRTKDRWVSIAHAHFEQAPLPAVELLKVGEMYVVRDGKHRVSVARARGQDFIDANVTEIDISLPADASSEC
jgi:hypothetical protein